MSFPPNSRYYRTATAEFTRPDGQTIIHLKRRFVPSADQFQLLFEHKLQAGERLDTIAANELGDPLVFWRLCDANNITRPEDLLELDSVRITLPQGVTGTTL